MPVIRPATIEISIEKYKEMVKVEAKLSVIKSIAQAENGEYGYSQKASEIIDAILGIEREEK